MTNFSNVLDKLIKNYSVNAARLSAETEISEGRISEWRRGKKEPSLKNLMILAEHFDVSIDFLAGRTNNPKTAIDTSLVSERGTPTAEEELLRIYATLDVKHRHRLMEIAWTIEDESSIDDSLPFQRSIKQPPAQPRQYSMIAESESDRPPEIVTDHDGLLDRIAAALPYQTMSEEDAKP
jgi:transcriptional regulator with XRE-family HTH domain